jgi:hypothetical protein
MEPFAKNAFVEIFPGFFSFNKIDPFLLVIKIKYTLYLAKPKFDSWQVIKDSTLMSSH